MVYAVCDLKGGGREALPEPFSEQTGAETTPVLVPFCAPQPLSQRGGVGSGNAQEKSSHPELEEAVSCQHVSVRVKSQWTYGFNRWVRWMSTGAVSASTYQHT